LSLSVHESAHAWTANRLGDPTARQLGRISMNPLVHMDLVGTFIVPLVAYASGGFIIGWAKPVPVNTAALRNPRRDHMLVAAAGPASNLILAAVLFVTLFVVKTSSSSMELLINQVVRGVARGDGAEAFLVPLLSMAYFGLWLNILLAIFNMLPVAPLDGAAVLAGLLPEPFARGLDAIQAYGFIILLALLYYGIPNMLFSPVVGAVRSFLLL
jgi:Zn-dependent protease